jgi:putative hydrolase of the HAD superfamily
LNTDEAVIDQLYKDRVKEKSVPFDDISPSITGLLEGLKDRGIKLGLISNCTEEEVQSWPGSKLAPYFDEVLFSYETGCAKPDPQIYELACSRLGVEAASCIFIGDGGSQELDGAKAAGMLACHAVWFLPESMRGSITAYKKIERPEQLFEICE